MFYKKKGMPEVGQIELATVKKISYHSVFVTLDEYENLEGFIHISEISPGRIRNIRDFVKEDKKIVCKVLRTDKERGNIDLSIRRVNQTQKLNKLADIKSEAKSEKLLELVGKKLEKDMATMYKEVGFTLIEKFGSLNDAFQSISLDQEYIEKLKFPKQIEKLLIETIQDKIKIPEIEIKGVLEISTEDPNGIDIIKKVLTKAQKGTIKITYVGAPKYKIQVTASDYKTAEGILKQAQEDVIKEIEEAGGIATFSKSK